MKSKYYAVKVGRKPGIYSDWETCKKQVYKYPGAIYKSFTNYPDAKIFLIDDSNSQKNNSNKYYAYVDGSYNVHRKEYSGAYVLLKDGQVIREVSKKYSDEASVMQNVAGEIAAAKICIEYCLKTGIKELIICHDYQGIASWCTEEWKAKNKWTQEYATFFHKASADIKISFQKVKGHSGDEYNERADELAKLALK